MNEPMCELGTDGVGAGLLSQVGVWKESEAEEGLNKLSSSTSNHEQRCIYFFVGCLWLSE